MRGLRPGILLLPGGKVGADAASESEFLESARQDRSVRIILWHGYLLGGTGSNVYTRALARAWSRLGHEVVVVCQEPNPGAYDLGGDRVYEVPPGVDVEEFKPEPRVEALERLLDEARRDPPNPGNAEERLPDEGNAERLATWYESDEPTGLYFGKLLYNKGVHILFEALRETGARALIVGFGDYRTELARIAPPRTLFTGPLEHRHLVHLIPLCEVSVVPSIFPEAFGMVAAEAAAGGSLPVVARHSGLAEVAAGLEAEYPPDQRDLASFETGNVEDLTAKLARLLALTNEERETLRAAARRAVVERWSCESV